MKQLFTFLLLLMLIGAFLPACQNNAEPEGSKLATEGAMGANPAAQQAPAASTPTNEPPQNAAGVWHFTCPKGCAGGAGSAVPCGQCGTTLVHNQIYHGEAQPMSSPAAPGDNAAAPAKKDEPPQNAKGVWHFTCPKGCSGGAGAAAPCPQCGTVMTHNAVYHQ
ncbi:MAG TPA: hypothetical protein VK168_18190 [Saprospiraceae bacterium]|nr:hypothetical protein [Saprospiraceae bacterium]